jgi:hypothetical protein
MKQSWGEYLIKENPWSQLCWAQILPQQYETHDYWNDVSHMQT